MESIPPMRPTPPVEPTPALAPMPKMTAIPDANRKAVLAVVRATWSRFSEQEVCAMRNKADLVAQIVSKYEVAIAAAQSEVDEVLKGRSI